MGGKGDTCRSLIQAHRTTSLTTCFFRRPRLFTLYGLCVQVADAAGWWRRHAAACIVSSGALLPSVRPIKHTMQHMDGTYTSWCPSHEAGIWK